LSIFIGITIGYGVTKLQLEPKILPIKKDEDENIGSANMSNHTFTSLESVSTESVDVQKEILTTLAQIRAINEFQERKGEKYFESSGRILNCPSKLLQRAKYRDNIANRDEALKNWTLKFSRNYKHDGVFVVPSINFSALIDELLAESSYIIVKSFCRDSCSKSGVEFEKIFNHDDTEAPNERCIWCEFREHLTPSINKLLFACHFYKEFLCFQIFQNVSIGETNNFINKLYEEMNTRYSDEFLDTPLIGLLTDDIPLDHKLVQYYNYTRLAAQQWAEIFFRLGTHLKLPFKPIKVLKNDTEHIFRTSDANIFEETNISLEIFDF